MQTPANQPQQPENAGGTGGFLVVIGAVVVSVLLAGVLCANVALSEWLAPRTVLRHLGAALELPPIAITSSRAPLSEGGPNDYYSNGDYWWPDPTKPDGLPYIQRDGQTNPENFNQHRMAIRNLRDAVAVLAAAYEITRDDTHVTKAVELLRVFFLDPSTRMNPHLSLCQVLSHPGDDLWTFELADGRGIRKAVAFLHPFLADKSKWPHKPDVQAWEGWPARQPALVFSGVALGEKSYLELWQKLPPDPTDPEVRRNIAITQPLLWLKWNRNP